MVLIKQHGSAADLPDDQIELPVVPKIAGDYGASVAVVIGSREKTNVKKVAATDVAGNIEEHAFALVAAEIVAFLDDVPGILDPPLAETGIEFAGELHTGAAILRL
jgi:hypothetical protein